MSEPHPVVSLIWAMSENRVIGRNNQLPWHLPADLQYFKKTTSGHPIIMGRKNYDSIGRPLPNRTNIVLTRDKSFTAEGCVLAHDTEAALAGAGPADEVFIIGGAEIYRAFLPQAQRLYVTEIHASVDGDTTFPDYDTNAWQEVARERHQADDNNPFDYSFVRYQRKEN